MMKVIGFLLLFIGNITLANISDGTGKAVIANNLNEVLSQIEYPITARKEGVEFKVYLDLTIGESGLVIEHKIHRAPFPQIENQISKAVEKLRFTPPTDQKGQPVKSKATVMLEFKLTD